MNTKIAPTDLTQRPPRSFHVRLGSLVILPRMLDKGRATLAKKNGEYNYNSSTDQHLVRFLGFDPDALLKELGAGKGDGESLGWVQAHSKIPRAPWETEAWSAYMERRGPDTKRHGSSPRAEIPCLETRFQHTDDLDSGPYPTCNLLSSP